MATRRLKLTRSQLAAFLPDAESIRQFETFFETANDIIDSTVDDPYGAIGDVSSGDSSVRNTIDTLIVQIVDRAPQPAQPSELDQWGALGQPAQPSQIELWDAGRGGSWVDQFNPIFPKTSGKGFRVDVVSPSFPWKDIIGLQNEDLSGVNSPTLTAFRGGLCRTYAYTTNDKMDVKFHIPHDYLAGSDIFVHIHWLHNGTAITGNFTGSIAHTYAKGHNQAIFPAEKTVTVTYATVDIATTPQYRHRIDEVQLSSNGGSATLMDSALLEPDGVIQANFTLTALPTITGGTTTRVFIPFIDIHYQSTGIGTKQKAPAFYV